MTDVADTVGEIVGEALDRFAPPPIEPIRCLDCGDEFLWWSTFFLHQRRGVCAGRTLEDDIALHGEKP